MTCYDTVVIFFLVTFVARPMLLLLGACGSKAPLAWQRPSIDGTFEAIIRWNLDVDHYSLEPHARVRQSMRPLAPSVAAAPLH